MLHTNGWNVGAVRCVESCVLPHAIRYEYHQHLRAGGNDVTGYKVVAAKVTKQGAYDCVRSVIYSHVVMETATSIFQAVV